MERKIFVMPSVDGSEYDMAVMAPVGMGAVQARKLIEAEIARANIEDSQSADGCCLDGSSVGESISKALKKKGFDSVKPITTICWDAIP